MKHIRLLIMTALSLMTMQSFAQNSLESLRKLLSSSPVTMVCDYDTMIRNAKVTGHSELNIQGQMYTMRGNGLEVYCDGSTLWTMDESSREVVIESCLSNEKDYMSNPVLLLADIDELFKIRSRKSMSAGREEYILDAVAECGVSQATLILNADGTVVSGKFLLEDGNTLNVKVQSMKKTEEKQKSFFSPQRKFGSDWIVTDLR